MIHLRAGRLSADVLPLGATLRSFRHDDVELTRTLPDDDQYLDPEANPYLGSVVGRVANRLAGASVTIGGVDHALVPNEGPNQLHGGPAGFARRPFAVVESSSTRAILTLRSEHGDQGYPGTLDVTAAYHLDADGLTLELTAVTDRPTIVNLTHHPWWRAGDADVLRVNASRVIEVDEHLLPTGAIGERDLRGGVVVGDLGGVDHCWLADADPLVVDLHDHVTGRQLTIESDAPAVQLFRSGEWLCLEPQSPPDAPHHPSFGSIDLRPGEVASRTIRYTISV